MKLSQAKEFLPLVQAAAEGKTIQQSYENRRRWEDLPGDADLAHYLYPEYLRIKPEPKLRPWKPEEVPVGALIRIKNYHTDPTSFTGMILARNEMHAISTNGPIEKGGNGFLEESFKYYMETYLHSTDNGKTWLPCGVEEIA